MNNTNELSSISRVTNNVNLNFSNHVNSNSKSIDNESLMNNKNNE